MHRSPPPRARPGIRTALRRILFLARAEVLHVVRDRATLVQIVALPVVQLLVLSNAATFDIRRTPTYVVDFDRSSVSRELVSRFAASGHFRILGQSASIDVANELMRHGGVTMIVTIPHDFEESLVRSGTAPVQLTVNAEKGSAAGIVQSYAARILGAYSAELGTAMRPMSAAIPPGGDETPARGGSRIEVRARSWYNPALDYRHYMVPGILVALVTMIGTLLSAQNIVREKEVGTLEQLNVTSITKGQFITAKLLPLWVLALFDLALGLVVGRLAFGMPVRGSLLLLFAAAAIYLVVALSIGLWISALVDTQQQAMFVTFFIMMIYLLMSGLLTPLDSMPRWVQVVSELNPVRHFVTISRAILVKGAGLAEIARPLVILVLYAAAVLWLAVRQYSKRTA
ncbi:MAG: ABC transporter permease [Gemmatimonadaceae bacterium]